MEIIKTSAALKNAVEEFKNKGFEIGFVPTMGALHQGHISLVKRCRAVCGKVVVSIFVNPTQFNDKNDLKNYPRTPEQDLRMLEKEGVDIVFMPATEHIYPEQDTRVFDFGMLDKVMEGAHRPGHFNGVAQVVSKLFEMVSPDKAFFGEKDFQQVAIVRKMTEDLGMGVEIISCPITRDVDGLALSSRNALLSEGQREAAPLIYKTLCEAKKLAETNSVQEVTDYVLSTIAANEVMEPEYFMLVDEATLQPIKSFDEASGIYGCVTVRLGNVRLIDNLKFK